jgi:hypothetical protein
VKEREANLFAAQLIRVESLFKPRIKPLNPAFESFEQDHLAGVLIVDQVKAAVPEGTAVWFDRSKGKGIK